MKINKSSLHYKFNKFWSGADGDQMPTTLCGYFWYTLFNMIIRSVVTGAIGVGVLYFMLTPVLRYFTDSEIVHGAATAALFMYSLAALILIGGLFFNKSSFGRVVFEYIKSIKTKVCPLIEYNEEIE